MNTNVGAIDRLIRLLLAAGLFYLGFSFMAVLDWELV